MGTVLPSISGTKLDMENSSNLNSQTVFKPSFVLRYLQESSLAYSWVCTRNYLIRLLKDTGCLQLGVIGETDSVARYILSQLYLLTHTNNVICVLMSTHTYQLLGTQSTQTPNLPQERSPGLNCESSEGSEPLNSCRLPATGRNLSGSIFIL